MTDKTPAWVLPGTCSNDNFDPPAMLIERAEMEDIWNAVDAYRRVIAELPKRPEFEFHALHKIVAHLPALRGLRGIEAYKLEQHGLVDDPYGADPIYLEPEALIGVRDLYTADGELFDWCYLRVGEYTYYLEAYERHGSQMYCYSLPLKEENDAT